MRLLFISFILLINIFFSYANAEESEPLNGLLILQTVQDQFVFDNTTIKSAMIIEKNGQYKGLEIELKPEAASQIDRISREGLGKQVNILVNKRIIASNIIQAPLKDKLLVTGLSKGEAQAFLIILRNVQQEKFKKLEEELVNRTNAS